MTIVSEIIDYYVYLSNCVEFALHFQLIFLDTKKIIFVHINENVEYSLKLNTIIIV